MSANDDMLLHGREIFFKLGLDVLCNMGTSIRLTITSLCQESWVKLP